ncbi:uncharacterized protein LOC112468084 [Temnothorax curvispinosus]|uniref:Uncharacterized protein LOC112468084 n=1 Tax=Temnothorax curvispinosus TaxID=300111 RepID=A0A6J1RJL7_9HYME|nr:uncharacterized protein LOC112468084 [Temnothorax curvispinosus]
MVFHRDEGFFNTVTRQFGLETTLLLKSWINIKIKTISANQQLKFLLRCRRSDVLPPHLHRLRLNIELHSNRVRHEFTLFKKRIQLKLLNFEISDANINLCFLRSTITGVENQLRERLPQYLINNFFMFNTNYLRTHDRKTQLRLINKFDSVMSTQNPIINSLVNIDYKKWIINLSNKQIPERVFKFLSLGDRFALPIDTKNKKDRVNSVVDIIKNFEFNIYQIPDDIVDEARDRISNSLFKFLRKNKHTNYIDRFILQEFKFCKRFLCDNDDLLVTRADKGQVTVILERNTYVNKMIDLLNDSLTYKKLKNDPTRRITSKINILAKSWFSKGIISEQLFRHLNCTNGNLPRCYGLPKIHKDGSPLRIIVSTLGSPLYNMAYFLHNILEKSVPKPESYIKDGWSFVELIGDVGIGEDDVLISLDVASLFTNIPKDLVLKAIERRWNHISKETKLSRPQFLSAVDLILSSTSFSFNGQIYEQIFGSPMGSPLSPILADMVMEDLETHCLQLLSFHISFFKRYVDDIFAIVPRSGIDELLRVFNSYHTRLKFTFEIEKNNSLSFLDTIVIREGTVLLTNWYRKPTFSGRYINYFSNHPLKYKINTIRNLVDRAILLSDVRFHKSNLIEIKKILSNNCYPIKLINKYINIRLNELQTRHNNNNRSSSNNVAQDPRKFITIPYIKGLSDGVGRTMRDAEFRVLLTIPKRLDCIIKRGKDTLPNLKQTELIYEIDCANCNAAYIGQTKRHLETRVKEHFCDIRKNIDNHSVVSKHRLTHNHDFNWQQPKILYKERHFKKREISEMFFIKKCDSAINLQKDTESLPANYNRLIGVT